MNVTGEVIVINTQDSLTTHKSITKCQTIFHTIILFTQQLLHVLLYRLIEPQN